MPKIYFIGLKVEEIALGATLSKLHDMPGIVDIDLNLGHGGQGTGRKQLEEASAKGRGESAEQSIIRLLTKGPMHISELSSALGGKKSRAYGAVHQLKKKGLTEIGPQKGTHQLTHKARTQLGIVQALPAPAPSVKHGPAGRASPGSGNIVLRSILGEGAKSPAELRALAAGQGISAKSITGVIDRAKKAGLIKKNGNNVYELTAKGLKIETGVTSHG